MSKIFLATADHFGRLEELFLHHSSGLNSAEVPAAQARYAGSSTLRFSKSLDVMKGIDSSNKCIFSPSTSLHAKQNS